MSNRPSSLPRRRSPGGGPVVCILALLAGALLACSGAFAWGDDTHKAVTRGALTVLPAEMRPFFLANAEFLAAHSLDPDYIPNRTLAQRAEHFLDLDDYGTPPFAELPRDRAEAVRKFGEETVVKRGLLPWTVQREHDRLARALAAGDWADARMATAFLAHFVADIHMPLHATANYDGQATQQRGIHFRVEDELMARYHAGRVAPAQPRSITATPADWAFAELARSFDLVAPLLVAEMKARQSAPLDSDLYYAEFERLAGPILAPRVQEAASALGALLASAWTQAGKPALPPARAVAVISELPGKDPAGNLPAPAAVVKTLTEKLGAWDAIALLQTGAPRRDWRFTVPFRAAADTDPLPDFATPAGALREAVTQSLNALAQFPAADRRLVIVASGEAFAAAAPQIAKPLKDSNIRVILLLAGQSAADARAKEAANAAALTLLHPTTPDRLLPALSELWAAALAAK
jgi:hypothetical protein